MSYDVSGITFIKNGLTLGYPIKESILSIGPLCKEIIINVGFDNPELTEDDGTYEYLRDAFPEEKFIFLKSYWDPNLTQKGLILSEQTNIALSKASGKYIQYIQGDECLHENDLDKIKASILEMDKREEINGLVFNYHHFYGSTDIIKRTKKTYRREIRLVRNYQGIKSWLDAQGFRDKDDKKIKCITTAAKIYHYGWARAENLMTEKTKAFERLYHGDKKKVQKFEYERIWGLHLFLGTHPQVMKNWVKSNENNIDIFGLKRAWSLKDIRLIVSDNFESLTGIRLGEYKNFILLG